MTTDLGTAYCEKCRRSTPVGKNLSPSTLFVEPPGRGVHDACPVCGKGRDFAVGPTAYAAVFGS